MLNLGKRAVIVELKLHSVASVGKRTVTASDADVSAWDKVQSLPTCLQQKDTHPNIFTAMIYGYEHRINVFTTANYRY